MFKKTFLSISLMFLPFGFLKSSITRLENAYHAFDILYDTQIKDVTTILRSNLKDHVELSPHNANNAT